MFGLPHNDPVYLISTLNRELNKLSTWFAANQLSLNLTKTNFVAFKSWQKNINEQPILRVSEMMFLIVFLDDNLTWKSHISLVASKLSKSIGIIHKSRIFSLNSPPSYFVRVRVSLGWYLQVKPSEICNLTETCTKNSEQLYLRCPYWPYF